MIKKMKEKILRKMNENLSPKEIDYYFNLLENKQRVEEMSLFKLVSEYFK